MSIAFLFPGQGTQAAGMGRELYDRHETVRRVFDEASAAAGLDVRALCDDAEALAGTAGVQPALVTLECALAALLTEEYGVRPAATAGLSLGEYAALACGGVLPAGQAVALVAERGRRMEEAARAVGGAMAAVLQLAPEGVEDACRRASDSSGQVWPCNYNCPGQIVIGGEKAAVERASALCRELGARRVLPLAVAGAFHTPYMAAAADAFLPTLTAATFAAPAIPVYSNGTARPHEGDVAQALHRQITSPVRWEETLRHLAAQGIDTFVEVGPGKTLTGFVKKTLPDAKICNVEDEASLAAALEVLEVRP